MPTLDQLHQLHQLLAAVPFVPFTVRTMDGRAFKINDPLDCDVTRRVWLRGEQIFVTHIASIEPAADSATNAERVADDEHWPADRDLPAAGGGI
jgi:hypothetical protein